MLPKMIEYKVIELKVKVQNDDAKDRIQSDKIQNDSTKWKYKVKVQKLMANSESWH